MPLEELSITTLEEPQATSTPIDTTPPAPAAEPAPPTPASQDEPTPATEVQTDAPPKADDTPKPSAREKLIAKLTGVGEETEPESPEAEAPPPEPKAEGTEQPKAEKPPEPPPEDEKEVTNEDIAKMRPGEARRKINRLLQKNREVAPMVEMAKEIVETCEKHGMTPADYKAWVALGLGLQTGNPQALDHLKGLADKAGLSQLGLTPELDAYLTAQEKALEIAPSVVAELRKQLGVAPPEAPAAPPRQPRPQPSHQPPSDPVVAATQRANREIARLADSYEKQIGADRFKALEPRIMAALAQRQGSHPDAWTDIFRSVVETEIAKAPKPAPINPALRPGTSPTATAPPQFKSERERVIHQYAG